MAGAHDERMVAHQVLQVVNLAVVGAVGRVGADDLGLLPGALEIILGDGAAVAEGAEGKGAVDMVLGVRGGDGEDVAELVQRDLLLHGVGELAADLAACEVPLDLHAAEVLDEFLPDVDELRLLVAEVETVAEAEAGDAVLAVEGRDGDLVAEGEFGQHDRQVDIVRPVEHARAVREGQGVAGERGTRADERNLRMQAALGIAVEEEALLLAVALVENDEAAGGARRLDLRRAGRHLHGLREAGPLAEVAGGVKIRHARRVVRVGGAFVVAEIEEALFLVEVGLVEEHEQPAQNVVILDLLVVGDPAVAQPLQDEADAVHLAVGAGGAAEGPAEAVRAHEIGHHLDVLLGVSAEGGQLAVADAAVGMELERGADEDKVHHAVEVEIAAEAGGGVVEEPGRAGGRDALNHALDEARGLVLLGEAEAEAGDGLGDVERLPVVVVVAAVEELLVDALAGLLDEPLPDGVALLGGAEGEEAEGGVGQAVFGGGLGEHLRRDAAGGEVDQVEALEGAFARGPVKFAEGEGDVAGLVGTGLLAVRGKDGAVGLDRIEIMGQHRAGHIETLLGKTVHAVVGG